jgi:hypothetical protein
MGDILKEPDVADDEFKVLIDNSVKNTRKEERNKLLSETDKYVLPDFNITTEQLDEIKIYRQNLREFNYNDLFLNFPDAPSFIN